MAQIFEIFGSIFVNNNQANNSINQTAGLAEKAGGRMGGAFKKMAGVAAVAGAAGAAGLALVGKGAITAAADAEASAAQFSSVFGDLEGQAAESLSKVAGDAGVLENRMKNSFTKIASFAKVSGMDTAGSLSLAERAMVATADSAAFYDRSLEDTTESLQSFLKGNYENDAALGLSATETTRNEAANRLYGQSFKDLSESQKQLTLLDMVEQANAVSGALGQSARETDGLTNVLGNLKQAWNDFLAVIGKPALALVIPILKGITEGLQFVTEKLQGFMDRMQDSGAIDTWKEKLSGIKDTLMNAFTEEGFSGIIGVVTGLIPKMAGTLLSQMPTLLAKGQEMVTNILNGILQNIPQIATTVVTMIQSYISSIATFYPMILQAGVQILVAVIEGIVQALPQIVTTITGLVTTLVSTIGTLLPVIIQAGIQLLTALVTGILNALPTLVGGAAQLIETVVGVISTNLPVVIQAGVALLKAVIQGIVDNLPLLLQTIATLLATLVQVILENLPMIIQAGIQILKAVIQGIVELLPQLVSIILQLLVTIVNTLIQNLPMIIAAGVELLLALIDGIMDLLPMLIQTAITLVVEIIAALATMAPSLVAAGVQILIELVKGVIRAIPKIYQGGKDAGQAVKDAFKDIDWLQIGVDIILGIVAGITSVAGSIGTAVAEAAKGALSIGKKILGIKSPSTLFRDQIGKFIPQGIAVGIEAEADVPMDALAKLNTDMSIEGGNIRNMMAPAPQAASQAGGGNGVSQTINIHSPKALTTNDAVRKLRRASQQLATE